MQMLAAQTVSDVRLRSWCPAGSRAAHSFSRAQARMRHGGIQAWALDSPVNGLYDFRLQMLLCA